MRKGLNAVICFALLLLIVAPANAAIVGKTAILNYGGDLFQAFLLDPKVTWEDAKDLAESIVPGQSHLATIESQDQNEAIFGLFGNLPDYWQLDSTERFIFGPWIGGFREAGAASVDDFQWIDGTPWDKDWAPWGRYQPDEYDLSRPAVLQYGAHYTGPGQDGSIPADPYWSWNDINESFKYKAMVVENVPIPAAVYLFGSGLLGLLVIRRNKR